MVADSKGVRWVDGAEVSEGRGRLCGHGVDIEGDYSSEIEESSDDDAESDRKGDDGYKSDPPARSVDRMRRRA